MVWPEDLAAWKKGLSMPLPFPFIGEYIAPGFEKYGDAMFVDSSGMGGEYEPAMTRDEMIDKIEAGKAYAIVSTGQFQVYVQGFTRA